MIPGVADRMLSVEEFLPHWQGHRRLTRRVIEAFPRDALFTFSIGGMRSFGDMALELVSLAAPMVREIISGSMDQARMHASNREELLRLWDQVTEDLDSLYPSIAPERFSEVVTVFGQYTAPVREHFLYLLENEIHHRGQGYVYLRGLGIDPPPFWER
jgi:uncharacterized damage-inducible protein DinB